MLDDSNMTWEVSSKVLQQLIDGDWITIAEISTVYNSEEGKSGYFEFDYTVPADTPTPSILYNSLISSINPKNTSHKSYVTNVHLVISI